MSDFASDMLRAVAPLFHEETRTGKPQAPALEYAPAESHFRNGGEQHIYAFPNGYRASVVKGPYTYGGPEGYWEIAVLNDTCIDYSTPITSDVLGRQTDADLAAVLVAIAALPAVQS